MPHFAQQLAAARKARAMTQEQLAQAVHISRSRVSRWETGETVPDVEMIRKLSEVLACDLLSSEEKEAPQEAVPEAAPEVPEQPDISQPEEEAADAPEPPAMAKKCWLLAALAGVVVLVVLLILLLPGKEAPAVAYEPYTLEWFQQEQTPLEGQAHVVIASAENPVKAIRVEDFSEGVGWLYTFRCEEVNGVPFTVTKITQSVFNPLERDDFVFEGEELLRVMNGDLILRTDRPQPMDWGGGFPLQAVKGVGLAIEGVDENGNELVFHGYVELSQEIAE